MQGEIKRIFSGWMFAASPGLNAVEHPIYDVWLTDCKGAPQPAVAEAPAAPPAARRLSEAAAAAAASARQQPRSSRAASALAICTRRRPRARAMTRPG